MWALGSCHAQTISNMLPVQVSIIDSLALLRHRFECKYLLSFTHDHFPSLYCPHLFPLCCAAYVDSSYISETELWRSSCHQSCKMLLMCHLRTNNGSHQSTVTPQDLVTSVSYSWVSSPVLAAPGPVTCSDMEWGWSLHLVQAGVCT